MGVVLAFEFAFEVPSRAGTAGTIGDLIPRDGTVGEGGPFEFVTAVVVVVLFAVVLRGGSRCSFTEATSNVF